jgi:hypothetical protein
VGARVCASQVRTAQALARAVDRLLGAHGLADADTDPAVCDDRLRENFQGMPYTLEVKEKEKKGLPLHARGEKRGHLPTIW